MTRIDERVSTHVYKVKRISKEEMESIAGVCVYDQPPFCNAACPLKLDVKAMLKAAAENDFKKAFKIYESIAPFPLILSAGCGAPCEEKCRLCELGDGIAIGDIERAVALSGGAGEKRSIFRVRKKKKAAVFGSGLFALLLAGELEKKGYPVTAICGEADEEEYLRVAAGFLREDDFYTELKRLRGKDIAFEFNAEMTRELFEEKRGGFDVLCASEKAALDIFPGTVRDEGIMLMESEGLLTGGGETVLEAALGARKAALTADRLAQGIDPRSARGEEGPVTSRLYTNPDLARGLIRIKGCESGYTREQASEEAGRCMQCHCDECLRGCAYLRRFNKHPGLLSREIYNNTQIIMGDHPLNRAMNACALCGQCTVTCPHGFDMAHVCRTARENMVDTDKMPLAAHEFALLDMLFSNGEAYLCRKQPGHSHCRYVFFPGCQAAAIAPEAVIASYEDLCTRLKGGVALMLGCCGAIAHWAGRGEMYGEVRDKIAAELAALEDPVIIAGCPSCMKLLSEQDMAETVGIWTVLRDRGLPDGARGGGRAVFHDACGARGYPETRSAVRHIMEELGYQLIEEEYSGDSTQCCGYGGLTAYADRETAGDMAKSCLKTPGAQYVSYCMACRDRFAREGADSRHILELVYGIDAGAPPDISKKRHNRLTLKNRLLSELWGEEGESTERPYRVDFTQEALEMMDERMILKTDIYNVLDYMLKSGEAVEDAESGMLIARKRCGNVTFWTAYTETAEGYTVHRAYSHRMTVEKRN